MQLLDYTLDSITRQSLPAETFEVLVVDDGSSDGTRGVAESYADRMNLRYFFQPDEGWRVARARNVGIAAARSPRCVFLDSGVLAHSGLLAAHVAALDSVDGPSAVTGYVYCFARSDSDAEEMRTVIDPTDVDATIGELNRTGRYLDVREPFYVKYGDSWSHLPAPWVVYWTCNVAARTADLRTVGMFDEAFRSWGGEDIDLAYRLHLAGASFILSRDAAAIHYPHRKVIVENEDSAVPNYMYMREKYGTPIMQLVPFTEEIHPLTINDVIAERGLPRCADYLAGAR
jgi:glycosyltransferase involved in cell wall biosynthesis